MQASTTHSTDIPADNPFCACRMMLRTYVRWRYPAKFSEQTGSTTQAQNQGKDGMEGRRIDIETSAVWRQSGREIQSRASEASYRVNATKGVPSLNSWRERRPYDHCTECTEFQSSSFNCCACCQGYKGLNTTCGLAAN